FLSFHIREFGGRGKEQSETAKHARTQGPDSQKLMIDQNSGEYGRADLRDRCQRLRESHDHTLFPFARFLRDHAGQRRPQTCATDGSETKNPEELANCSCETYSGVSGKGR